MRIVHKTGVCDAAWRGAHSCSGEALPASRAMPARNALMKTGAMMSWSAHTWGQARDEGRGGEEVE